MSSISSLTAATIDPRDTILRSARLCFASRGFSRTTMSDLAAAARIEKRILYQNFSSKDDIILALIERERDKCINLIRCIECQGNQREVLFAVIAEYVVAIPPDAARLLVEIWTGGARDHRIASVIQRMEVDIEAWFVRTLTALEPSPQCDPPEFYAALYQRLKDILIARASIPSFAVGPAIANFCEFLDIGLRGSHGPHRRRHDRRWRCEDAVALPRGGASTMTAPYGWGKQPEPVRRARLDCNAKLALKRCFAPLTAQAVGETADVTKGGPLHRIVSEQDLIDGAVHGLLETLDADIEAAVAVAARPRGRFTRAYVMVVLDDAMLGKASLWTAPYSSALTEPSLRRLAAERIACALQRHRATDDERPLEVVRLAVDGAWLAALLRDDDGAMPDLAALRERLIAMTRSA